MLRKLTKLWVAAALLLALTAGVAVAASVTCQPNRACVGTEEDDQITGTEQTDSIQALGGDDDVSALGGIDVVLGGPGLDFVQGGNDKDILIGEGDGDCMLGQDGDDVLLGGPAPVPSDSRCDANSAGRQAFQILSGSAFGFGGSEDGNDSLIGGDDPDFLNGGAGTNLAAGLGGGDIIFIQDDESTDDRALGGEGDDIIFAEDGTRDYISCGGGSDLVFADEEEDVVGGDCEDVNPSASAEAEALQSLDVELPEQAREE